MSDDFNPFSVPGNSTQQAPTQGTVPFSSPIQQPHSVNTNEPPKFSAVPPQPAPQGDQRVPIADLERRQRELDDKARDLERREKEQEARMRRQQETGQNNNNWPPLPGCCPMQPCFRQDFDLDFQDRQRSLVKRAYYNWLLHVCVWLLNVLGTLAFFIGSSSQLKYIAGTMFGGAILFLLLMTPLSLLCWYRRLYSALKSDSSLNYFIYFITSAVIILIDIMQCLGINWIPSCGWINGLSMLGDDKVAAGIMLGIAFLFTLMAVIDSLLLFLVHSFYRGSGASFDKAKQELGRGVASEAVSSVVVGGTGGR